MTDLAPAVSPRSHLPVVALDELVALARELVPVAIRRQLWVFFFDLDAVPLPLVVPIDIGPGPADESSVAALFVSLGRVAHEFGAASIAILIERPGIGRVGSLDQAWGRVIRGCSGHASVPLVAVLACTDAGVHDVPVDVTPPGSLGEIGRGVHPERHLISLDE